MAVEEEEREEGVRTQTDSGSVLEEPGCEGDGAVRIQALGTRLRGSGEAAAVETRLQPGCGLGDGCEFSGSGGKAAERGAGCEAKAELRGLALRGRSGQ